MIMENLWFCCGHHLSSTGHKLQVLLGKILVPQVRFLHIHATLFDIILRDFEKGRKNFNWPERWKIHKFTDLTHTVQMRELLSTKGDHETICLYPKSFWISCIVRTPLTSDEKSFLHSPPFSLSFLLSVWVSKWVCAGVLEIHTQ